MASDKVETAVFEALSEIPVIDAHEHLRPESERTARKVDFFILFSTYSKADLCGGGMAPEVYDRLRNDQDMPVEQKWKEFSPFYPHIRHGAYARPARIWLKDVLGYDDLTDANYAEVSAKLQEWNVPGLYDRILCRMCHIRTALVACETYQEYDFDLLKPLWRVINFISDKSILGFARGPQTQCTAFGGRQSPGRAGKGIGGYLDWMEEDFRRYLERGRVGVKAICFPYEAPDRAKADAIFDALRSRGPDQGLHPAERATLASVIYDRAFRLAQSHGLTVAVHSGVWGDFRESAPAHLTPIATRYPGVQFDLFHLGIPYVREAVMIGKMFPNVSLNLCWTTILSPELTVRMLDECIDMVPLNRIIAFGADYNLPVEKVYGHLKMAKQVVARVLAKRIRRGEMDLPEASRIAGMWFHDNALAVYHL